MFIPQAQPHAQSLFLFSIVFGINLIHFFDFFGEKEERCSRKFDRLLCCFDPLSITPFDSAKNANRFEKCNVFGNGKCEFSANQEGRNWGANFLARKSAKLVANTKVQIFGKEKCQNSSPILARQWWRHFRLSLSVSLSLSLFSPNVPHAQYRKRFRVSYTWLQNVCLVASLLSSPPGCWVVYFWTDKYMIERFFFWRETMHSAESVNALSKAPNSPPLSMQSCPALRSTLNGISADHKIPAICRKKRKWFLT